MAETTDIWSVYLEQLSKDAALTTVAEKYVPLGIEPEERLSRADDDEPDDIDAVIRKRQKIVLLGEPGAGKTWALLTLTRSAGIAALAARGTEPIPIYMELRAWGARPRKASAEQELLDILAGKVAARLGGARCAAEDLAAAMSAERFLLIFDGLDEIRQPDDRADLLDAAVALAGSTHWCAIGSRRYGFADEARAKLGAVGFIVCEPQRLDPPTKRRIIGKYVLAARDADAVLSQITQNYRLARLSDNVLLLRLLAQEYAAKRELPRTRGHLLRNYTDQCIDSVPLLAGRANTTRAVLSAFAQRMRAAQQTHLVEDTEVIPIVAEKAEFEGVGGSAFLDALLETRIIERLEVATHAAITFSLPQYEDYFLARLTLVPLERDIQAGRTKMLENEAVANRELHHVLIVAAGLLSEADCERLVDALIEPQQLFLKARILGEAEVPRAERRFVDLQDRKLRSAIRKALKDISRLWLVLLLLWAAAFLPLSFAVNWLWHISRWAAAGAIVLFAAHAAGIPFILQRLHRHVLRHFADRVDVMVHEIPRALSFVRTGDVRLRLRAIRDSVEGQRPRGHVDGDDVYLNLLDMIEGEITAIMDLSDRDLDTLLDEVRRNPHLIRQYLALAPETFVEKDIEVTAEFTRAREGDVRLKEQCVRQLIAVALVNARFRTLVIDALESIRDVSVHAPVVESAEQGLAALRQPVVAVQVVRFRFVRTQAIKLGTVIIAVGGGFALLWLMMRRDEAQLKHALQVAAVTTIAGVLVNLVSDQIRGRRPNYVVVGVLFVIAVLLTAAVTILF
jgi:hypothetical protein